VENLIANAGKISNEKLRQKVIDFSDQALMSKQLATIILDVPVEFDETRLIMERPDEERLRKLFDELEFRTFSQRVFTWLSLKDKDTSELQITNYELRNQKADTIKKKQKPGAQHDLFSNDTDAFLPAPANPKSEIRNPKSEIRNLKSEIQNPRRTVCADFCRFHRLTSR